MRHPGGAREPTFRAGVDLVTFGVTAVDRKGNLITDLTKDDFVVIEDGKPQTGRIISRGATAAGRLETHLGLILDTSGSMERDIGLARGAAIKFLNLLDSRRHHRRRLRHGGPRHAVSAARFRAHGRAHSRAQDRTAIPRSTTPSACISIARPTATGRSILVMYTDGADSRSTMRFAEVMNLLQGVADHGVCRRSGRKHRVDAQRAAGCGCSRWLEATGGQAFFPTALKDLDSAYEKVLAEIQAQYHLGYIPLNATQDGQWRKVEIKVKRPDVKLRARKGYFAVLQGTALRAYEWPEPVPSAELAHSCRGTIRGFAQTATCLPFTTASISFPTSSCAATRSTPCRSSSMG